ncbi:MULTISPECIES: cytochrome b [Pseudomonas]|uniref:cytochrome b n=1 Tax=Pseudomonas TaxID=286 RepID=UPI003990067C
MTVSTERYGRVAASLHWMIAVLIIINLVTGFLFSDEPLPPMPVALPTGEPPVLPPWDPTKPIHISVGVLVLVLTFVRLLWRLRNRPPVHRPDHMSRWEVLAAVWMHRFLYFLMIAIPLTGWLMISAHKVYPIRQQFFGLFDLPMFSFMQRYEVSTIDQLFALFRDSHWLLSEWGMPILLAIHIGALVKHHMVDKDPIMRRMWPWGKGAAK